MPKAFPETPEQRQKRRSVVRVLTRLSTALASPDVLSKDAGAAILGHRVGQLREVLDGEELELLDAQVQLYQEATGVPLPIPAPLPPVPPLPTRPSKAAGSQSRFRVHASDLQLTFNKASWIAADIAVVEQWFRQDGCNLAFRFQTWALEDLPARFRESLEHVSLTMEESCHSTQKRVHLHAQLTFASRIDRTSLVDFVFDGVQPHIEAWQCDLLGVARRVRLFCELLHCTVL